jgi:surface protein
MKSLITYINEKLILNKNTKPQKYNYNPKTKKELQDILKQLIEERGYDGDFNDIDTSEITDMSNLFFKSNFNGDISKWNVSNVTDMNSMFTMSDFNGDISKWNVSKVTDMYRLFYMSNFNGNHGDISDWNVSNVIIMMSMFDGSDFNGDLSKWILNLDCRTDEMFDDCPLKNNQKKWPQNYKPD